jgi:huntingtin
VKLILKKDKIQHLNLIHENVVSANIRQTDDYAKMLSLAMEAFLVYFDDEDQDVYFVAEECLNKTIKTLIDTNLNRFPADFYRFIRKNGPERSLRGALVRFAELCHLIKSHKCRQVFFNILKKSLYFYLTFF